jgi:hypothetical protein
LRKKKLATKVHENRGTISAEDSAVFKLPGKSAKYKIKDSKVSTPADEG